uniref:HAT family dimerisation domain containing protein n=1 Tax=Oryza sativa subsp. japonica TaxID=39947 RepID=Q2QP98_ORYSJ|nr:hAT family dimerisation domain containing protein [Oryza sativa Japonica Group]
MAGVAVETERPKEVATLGKGLLFPKGQDKEAQALLSCCKKSGGGRRRRRRGVRRRRWLQADRPTQAARGGDRRRLLLRAGVQPAAAALKATKQRRKSDEEILQYVNKLSIFVTSNFRYLPYDVDLTICNPSSAASVSVEAGPKQAGINSDDPAWAHCFCPDITKKHHLRCKYCDKVCTAGITRIKYHLAGIKGFNTTKCQKVPSPVQQEMFDLLTKKTSEKEQKNKEKEVARAEVDIENSDCESGSEGSDHGNNVLVVKPKETTGSSSSRSVAGGHTIDKYYKPPSIEESAKAIGQFGRSLKGPSPYEMSGSFLQKRKEQVMDGFKEHKESWELTGCFIMTDAWTDRKGRGVMNLVVHSAHGVLFLDSVECSGDRKDGKYIFELVDRYIEEIGEQHVVQVVTDNASVNTTAASLLTAKRPSIFWNGCAAHCLDLMLEDIGKLGPVEETIANARQVTVFLYAHTRVLDLMRKFLNRDLVRSGVTRFATAYLNLKSLLDNKKELVRLFKSDEMEQLGYLKQAKGKKASKVIRSETFWKNVDIAVNYFEPLANVLRRMDSDVPSMGFFHGLMLEAKKEISQRFDNDKSRFIEVWDIIDKRWDNKLKTPLHLAGYYLNPYYYYPNKQEIESDGSFRAAKWWLNHGTSTPNLRKLAARILSLTCSSSACERNWSVFEQVHTKKRNRLLHERMRDLVFVKFNSKLRNKRENKGRDPIEKEVDDVVADGDNEFITGVVPSSSEMDQQCAKESQQHTTPQAPAPAKRKRPVHTKKRKVRSLQSLMRNAPVHPEAPSSDSEDCDDGIPMHTSDSDKSPSPSPYVSETDD